MLASETASDPIQSLLNQVAPRGSVTAFYAEHGISRDLGSLRRETDRLQIVVETRRVDREFARQREGGNAQKRWVAPCSGTAIPSPQRVAARLCASTISEGAHHGG